MEILQPRALGNIGRPSTFDSSQCSPSLPSYSSARAWELRWNTEDSPRRRRSDRICRPVAAHKADDRGRLRGRSRCWPPRSTCVPRPSFHLLLIFFSDSHPVSAPRVDGARPRRRGLREEHNRALKEDPIYGRQMIKTSIRGQQFPFNAQMRGASTTQSGQAMCHKQFSDESH